MRILLSLNFSVNLKLSFLENKFDFIKLETFIHQRMLFKRMKRHPTEWENVFANHISDKGLTPRMYKELLQEQ